MSVDMIARYPINFLADLNCFDFCFPSPNSLDLDHQIQDTCTFQLYFCRDSHYLIVLSYARACFDFTCFSGGTPLASHTREASTSAFARAIDVVWARDDLVVFSQNDQNGATL
ncbi:hypothetical protein V6N13_106102 [Hibiscus sabdariffa]|uniref:Uncharacterized protein n=1 Tax=Hibiscus sabdariffa TaxID=183260 RepID=A0ABR2EZM9_9ROSI